MSDPVLLYLLYHLKKEKSLMILVLVPRKDIQTKQCIVRCVLIDIDLVGRLIELGNQQFLSIYVFQSIRRYNTSIYHSLLMYLLNTYFVFLVLVGTNNKNSTTHFKVIVTNAKQTDTIVVSTQNHFSIFLIP